MACHGVYKRTENIVSELRVLQAQGLELRLGLGAQGVRARSPEACNGGANCSVVIACEGVDVASICDLALGGRVDAVDLRAREGLESSDTKLLGERVDTGMFEELVATVVD